MSEKKVWNAKEHPIICDANGTYIKPKKSLWVADNTVLEGLVNQGFVVILDERQEELAASPKARTTRSRKLRKKLLNKSKKLKYNYQKSLVVKLLTRLQPNQYLLKTSNDLGILAEDI